MGWGTREGGGWKEETKNAEKRKKLRLLEMREEE